MNSWDYREQTWGASGLTRGASRVAFLKRVYGLFTASVLFSAIGALVALHAGVSASQAFVAVGGTRVAVPPLVAFFGQHYIIGAIVMIGSVFGASMVRHVKGLNVLALFGMATVIGVVIAPSLFYATLAAGLGKTLSSSPIRDAFLLSVGGFGGLTAYALTTKKDFSFLGGALTMGLFVIIGAGLLNLFLGSSVLGLAIASVSVLLFGAYVLYDTSRLLREGEDDAVGGAISLYMNFLNIFLALLRILSSRRGD
ncbi:Bax inhibitor-1 family protein [Polyangium spumosum]|uniref:BAX inhibitor (BI)-1/YccA family protein n=1 Tax=Polyangium spumosum TaxID=889282 RepID=A0A6N7PR44_9BACT|nr:Bax inhibitor-1/YccA family protein [Polyangium spumosum]MRG94518.1 BAX inhibitor (BI)-1/YccA family protein [Polyangium spumosum]